MSVADVLRSRCDTRGGHVAGRARPRRLRGWLLAASVLCGACAISDFKYIRNDLGMTTLSSPNVGVVVLVSAQMEREKGEVLLSASTEAIVASLTAKGFKPVVLDSQLFQKPAGSSAQTLPLFRDKAFGQANQGRFSGVLVLRLGAFWTTPQQQDAYYIYTGDTPVLAGGCWLDSYSPEGTLKGVRAHGLQGYDGLVLSDNSPLPLQVGATVGSYHIKSAEEWAKECAAGLIEGFVEPYRGRR